MTIDALPHADDRAPEKRLRRTAEMHWQPALDELDAIHRTADDGNLLMAANLQKISGLCGWNEENLRALAIGLAELLNLNPAEGSPS
jgi:hypothetical protein